MTRLHADLATPLTVLDGTSARELVEIPDAVADALEKDHPAHFSDFVRVSVLDRLGGIWVDATCWAPAPLPQAVAPLLTAGALYPRWTHRQIGNWFIAAVPSTPLIRLQRLALEAWWESGGGIPDYFLYHRIFEVLFDLVPEFHGQWDAAPTLSSAASHLLQLGMMQPWDPDALRFVAGASIVQKLSYKYDAVPTGLGAGAPGVAPPDPHGVTRPATPRRGSGLFDGAARRGRRGDAPRHPREDEPVERQDGEPVQASRQPPREEQGALVVA